VSMIAVASTDASWLSANCSLNMCVPHSLFHSSFGSAFEKATPSPLSRPIQIPGLGFGESGLLRYERLRSRHVQN
jgi:hypothetical protein